MKRILLVIVLTGVVFAGVKFLGSHEEYEEENEGSDNKYMPSDYFYNQRADQNGNIPFHKYFDAVEMKMSMEKDNPLGLTWTASGPYNIGGRITAIVVDPGNTNIIIAGAAAGGIIKSTDGGVSWEPKTDFVPSLSVGSLKMDPLNPNIIYCGTGEANNATEVYPGFGMLKSTDKGDTWTLVGLDSTMSLGEISISPQNPNTIYAASGGGLYSKGTNRGIYKSVNGGLNWTQVFYLNDSTSAVDVAIDPSDSNRVYAAMMERLRGPSFRKAGGVSSGVYMSTDAGATWARITNGLPAPAANIGRICIAVAPSNPNYVYTLYRKVSNTSSASQDNVFEGFYMSTNKGANWTRMPDGILDSEFSNFGWYFGMIEVDPTDHNKIYVGDVDTYRSTNGGTSWTNITDAYGGTFDEQHPDMHALWINPSNVSNIFNGNDGGMFITTNGGTNWNKSYDLPISQFYASDIDYQLPDRKYGGLQDNGSVGTKTGGTADWDHFYGGDGFVFKIDYNDSNVMYAESQNGGIGRSTNGGNSFNSIRNGVDFSRTNWNTPYILDREISTTLYIGTYKVFRSTNRGSSWTAISPDLTRGQNGRLGTITCISSAPYTGGARVIYTGTDDAKVSVTTNSGTTWTDVTGSLPSRYMTDVVTDMRNPATAYVSLSGYTLDENTPRIYRTTDFGATWTSIAGNLPDVPVNSIIIEETRDSILFVGTDAGVYYTSNLGATWQAVGTGLPNSPVFDINYHQPTHLLVAATHGRSIYSVDVSSIVVGVHNISQIAETYSLSQNYPNPFNPSTKIQFSIPKSGNVKITVYDVTGKEAKVLVNERKEIGQYEVEFNGSSLASGVYFYRIEAGDFREAKRMVLVK